MGNNKLRVIKDYDKLSDVLLELLKLEYPNGFTDYIIQYINPKDGKLVRAIELETEDKLYMIRLPNNVINDILEEEDMDSDMLDDYSIDDNIEDANTTAYVDIKKEIGIDEEDSDEEEDSESIGEEDFDDEGDIEDIPFEEEDFDEEEEI